MKNQYIYDKYGIYINHSFNSNICIRGCELIALCDIEIDDELFFNYNDILVCGIKENV